MGDTYKMITLVGTSEESYEDAVKGAIKSADATVRNLNWFEVKELRGRLQDGEVAEFQAKVEIGFKVEAG
jgi:flavin-binding protein dodecin